MDPAELLLSLPEWVLDIPVGAWFFFGLAALGILWLCVMSTGSRVDVIPGAHDEQESTYGRYEDPAPRKTRREALDEVLAGRMEWDDYLAYFQGWPYDGSLTKKQERIAAALEKAAHPREIIKDYTDAKLKLSYADNEVYTDLTTTAPKESTVLRRKKLLTISADRIRYVEGGLQVWQPSKQCWVAVPEPWGYEVMHDGRLHFTSIGGKSV